MKVRNIALAFGAAALILLMGSCDALFSNQFQSWGLGQVTNATINDAVTNNDVAAILEQSGLEEGGISESFLNAATQDEETAAQVTEFLQQTADNPETPPETAQAARVIIIEIELEMTGGRDFIDNIIAAVAGIDFNNLESFDLTDPDTAMSILNALFPPRQARLLPDGWTEEDMAALFNDIYDLGDNVDAIIAALNANGLTYYVEGIDPGWIAQVGAAVRVLHLVQINASFGTVGEALAALVNDGTDNPDLINIADYITNSDTLLEEVRGDQGIMDLFMAAGWDLNALLPAVQ